MTHTTAHLSVSLDGFGDGPDQGPDDPVGVGGLALHEWHWHAAEPGHETDLSARDDPGLEPVEGCTPRTRRTSATASVAERVRDRGSS